MSQLKAPTQGTPPCREVTEERDRLLDLVLTLSQVACAGGGTEALMGEIVAAGQALTRGTGAVVELLDGDWLEYRSASGSLAPHVGLRLKVEGSFSGLAVMSGSVQQCRDSEADHRVNLAACRAVGARSMLAVPLAHRGQRIGVLKTVSSAVEAFDLLDVRALQLAGGILGAVLGRELLDEETSRVHAERARAWELANRDLQDRALIDPLTQVGNRALFMEKLSQARQRLVAGSARPFAVAFLDLDGFKGVNDSLGHHAGDEALREVARRLSSCARDCDTVARLAGDEFVVLLEHLAGTDDATGIAGKMVSALRAPWTLEGQPVSLRASIGIAVQHDGTVAIIDLMRRADSAMYAAKAAGGNCVRCHGAVPESGEDEARVHGFAQAPEG